jgi:inosine-uridine nucleoside N-ribohydrolase
VDLHFDMETQDPDDILTLSIAATHPDVNLVGVSVTPGGSDQVGLVQHVLSLLGKDIPIGGDPKRDKPSVSAFHDKWLGVHQATVTVTASEVLKLSAEMGHTTLLTGGPLKNLKGLSTLPFLRWVGQGGFAGDSVVPPEHRLPKFEGRETCPTFNFNGAPQVALDLLATTVPIRLVSKNVCHGVCWDQDFHAKVAALPKRTAGVDLAFQGMSRYLKNKPEGKLIHDPLALAVAIDPTVCEFREVEVYRSKGEWGSKLTSGSHVQISVSVNRDRLFETLMRH